MPLDLPFHERNAFAEGRLRNQDVRRPLLRYPARRSFFSWRPRHGPFTLRTSQPKACQRAFQRRQIEDVPGVTIGLLAVDVDQGDEVGETNGGRQTSRLPRWSPRRNSASLNRAKNAARRLLEPCGQRGPGRDWTSPSPAIRCKNRSRPRGAPDARPAGCRPPQYVLSSASEINFSGTSRRKARGRHGLWIKINRSLAARSAASTWRAPP